MSLCNLNTPFERRRVIEYGAERNKVVRHWYEVQHIVGPLYKGRNKKSECGEDVFTLYILFPGINDGITYSEVYNDRYTAEQLLSGLEREGFSSREQAIATLDKRIECGAFIGGAWIEFVRQFDADRAECYAKHRIEFYARREEEDRQRAEEAARKEAEEAAKRQAELEAEKAVYLGWADKMTALRFGKVKAQMEKLARFDDKVMSYREFIIQSVKDGWMPEKREGVTTWYGSRWDKKESKPKTVYMLSKDNLCYTLNKTEFDFAQFLVSKIAS
ncbi:MAG: hypothetical protein NC548_45270 [Lachnospiraceae bacterium]|nr:hypothetical protein [Lachnospiraceae bacterium]